MQRWNTALSLPAMVHRAIAAALRNDALNLAQSAAYSAIFALFPALIVSAAIIALLPDVAPLKRELGAFFNQVLPSDVIPLLTGYFDPSSDSPRTVPALTIAALVSFSGASSVMATLMEGLRRASHLPETSWSFWQRRLRAIILVPISLLPLLIATTLVVFGRLITVWLAASTPTPMQSTFFAGALLIRWTVALTGVAGVTAAIYQLGTPNRQRWLVSVPGAIMATAMWFLSTLAFGWYVTRFANYGRVYGSLGAGIALLVWLYLVFLSVLCGAEFNVQWSRHRHPHATAQPVPSHQAHPG